MNVSERIIDYLVRNRVSTTEVADVLGKTGVLPNVMPVNRGHYKAGKIKGFTLTKKATGQFMSRFRISKRIV